MLPLGRRSMQHGSLNKNLFPLLDAFFPNGPDPMQRKLVVHIDNALGHNARVIQNFFEHNPLKRLPHPTSLPDLSPSDFYLFGKMKNALNGREISDEIDLLEVVTEILIGISHDELRAVFRNWIERVQAVIDANADELSS
jgi:hypothetical protein